MYTIDASGKKLQITSIPISTENYVAKSGESSKSFFETPYGIAICSGIGLLIIIGVVMYFRNKNTA